METSHDSLIYHDSSAYDPPAAKPSVNSQFSPGIRYEHFLKQNDTVKGFVKNT